jgi:hypothetical protein
VCSGLGSEQPIDAALADYQRARDVAGMPLYKLTCERARLEPSSPELQRVLAALQSNQAETDRFAGITAGIISPVDFFSPSNLARIPGETQTDRPRPESRLVPRRGPAPRGPGAERYA